MNADAIFDGVCALQAEGQYLAAHDQAAAALASGIDHDGLRHRAVLALAQSGATGSALRLFAKLGMDAKGDPEIAALGARLLKDQALAGQPGAARAAETAYGTLWRRSGEAWHGVNAAFMALLAGSPARAVERVRALGEPVDRGDYWSAVTIAEAALLAGDLDGSARWLGTAEARAGRDVQSRQTTRRQLRWIARLLGADPALVEVLQIPASVHFCGAIPRGRDAADAAPQDALRAQLEPALEGVRFGFGSLAAGADIVIAEMLLDRGAELTIVLPFPPDLFAAVSVRPSGADWLPRFHACLAQARVIVLEQTAHDDLDFVMVSRRAMGLARLHAKRIDGAVWQVAVPKRSACGSGEAGTGGDIAGWAEAGGQTRVLDNPWSGHASPGAREEGRVLQAVLFGDLPGFGHLDDGALQAFYAGPLQAIGPLTAAASYRNAWGDAVQVVYPAPDDAARCALGIQRTLSPEAFLGWGLPASLTPRLALDFGPLRRVRDAVQDVEKFAGRVMTRAARIEPVTPPGLIYATEAFACEIALCRTAPVTCDYSGLVPTAKDFGILPLYSVREV